MPRPYGPRLRPFKALQLATLVDKVPAGEGWLHEMKYDGYRCLLSIGGGEARAFTRSGLDWSDFFAPIVNAATKLKVTSALIDGEAVVLNEQGVSNFQALQASLKSCKGANLTYYAFDILQLDGTDLTKLPQLERKQRLEKVIGKKATGVIRYSDHIQGNGEKLLKAFCEAGLEGVVSKKADAHYLGVRSKAWLKTKCIKRQEFVIVGWLPSDKAGRGFRSLLLGGNDGGELRYAGKVGTGFDNAEIGRLLKLMEPLAQDQASVKAPRSEVRGAHWIKPKLVAEIAHTEMTAEGILRHPSYLGLRSDKAAKEVVLEKPTRTRRAMRSK